MKIVYVALLELEIHNAVRTHVVEVCANFKALGHDVILAAPKPWKNADVFPFKTSYVPFFGFSFARLWLFNFILCLHLFKLLRMEKPDCVYVRELFNPLPALLLKLLRAPYFAEVNDFILKTPHCKNRFIKSLYFKFCEKIELGCARGIFVPAEGIKKDLLLTYHFKNDRVHTVENGANVSLFYPMEMHECRKKLNLPEDAFILGYVGSFQDYHDLETVILALPQLKEEIPNIKLFLVGAGMGREKPYKELAGKLRLIDAVIFTGQVPYETVPFYINSFDAAFVTFKRSRLEQVLTVKLKEYLACGKPTIATELPDNVFMKKVQSVLKLIPPEDSQAFAKAVTGLFHDPAMRKNKGNTTIKALHSAFTWEHTAEQTLLAIDAALKH